MLKKIVAPCILVLSFFISVAQDIDAIIDTADVERIVKILSSDDMQGRKISTPGIDKAASFIANEFKNNKLAFWDNLPNYYQTFNTAKANLISVSGEFNNSKIEESNIITITSKEEININEHNGYTLTTIDKKSNLLKIASRYIYDNKNYLVIVDTTHAKDFEKIKRFTKENLIKPTSVIFVLSSIIPVTYQFQIYHSITLYQHANIVGIIPGNSKKNEYVIFSSHYDHLGIGKPNANMDSIYNGANDNASGVTAVILLSKYLNTIKNNERTLVFVAFTAEEAGGFGSRYFSSQINTEKAISMFNIEMIGTESKWGTNSAYITGYEKSDFGKILQNNLKGTVFNFEPDPYPSQKLFYRSDNASLAALGVPAHTISTSKMDSEPFYHTQEDEIETLNIKNIAAIIKAIAASSQTIITGKDTPTRIEKENY